MERIIVLLDIFFDCDGKTDDLLALIKEMLSGDELVVQKLGKKGRHKVLNDINLIEFIKSYKLSSFESRAMLESTLSERSSLMPSIFSARQASSSFSPSLTFDIVSVSRVQ